MSKPNVTLQPSKGIISEAAARIYAGYVAAGRVKDEDADKWIKRSIREAIVIAKTVDASVDSHDAFAVEESLVVRPHAHPAGSARSPKKSQAAENLNPRKTKAALEKVAEEVLMDDTPKHEVVKLELEGEPTEPDTADSSHDAIAKRKRKPQPENDSAVVAADALKRMSRTLDHVQ